MIDILILNYNCASETISLVEVLHSYKKAVRNILVVDNRSTDNSMSLLKAIQQYENVTIIQTERNGGYGYGNNFGLEYLKNNIRSNYVLVCNPDISVQEDVINAMEEFLKNHNDYLAVAPFMHDINNKRDYGTAYRIPSKKDYIFLMSFVLGKLFSRIYYSKVYFDYKDILDVGTVAGSLFMINLSLCPTTKIYDENIFLYCEEIVFGFFAKSLNLKIGLIPNICFIHKHSVSISKSYTNEIQRRELLLKSRMYLLYKYYSATPMELLLARTLGRISFYELYIKMLYTFRVKVHLY